MPESSRPFYRFRPGCRTKLRASRSLHDACADTALASCGLWLLVAHDFVTFDAKLDQLLVKKRALSANMLNGSGDVTPADFGNLEAPDGGNAFSNDPLTADDLGSLDPDAFEAFCALLWSKMGYARTIKTQRVGDGGIDVVAIKGDEGVLIQCKSSTVENRELGWEGVKDAGVGATATPLLSTWVIDQAILFAERSQPPAVLPPAPPPIFCCVYFHVIFEYFNATCSLRMLPS